MKNNLKKKSAEYKHNRNFYYKPNKKNRLVNFTK